MRTTIRLDDDVARAVERIKRERSVGVSQAVNELIRRGLAAREPRRTFRQRSRPMGPKLDVSNVAEALEIAEGPGAR